MKAKKRLISLLCILNYEVKLGYVHQLKERDYLSVTKLSVEKHTFISTRFSECLWKSVSRTLLASFYSTYVEERENYKQNNPHSKYKSPINHSFNLKLIF